MKPALPLFALLALACSGLPGGASDAPADGVAAVAPADGVAAPAPNVEATPGPGEVAAGDPAWVAAAVEEALAWEIMPGTTGEPEPGRAGELRAFFLGHPEYADATRRAALAEHACGIGTEGAHTQLTAPPAKVALELTVDAADWRVVVAHASTHCTSDDWSWYTSEVGEALQARGVAYGYGGPDHDVAVVRREGVEVARLPLAGQGFAAVRAGAAPIEVEYGPTEGVLAALDPYLGTRAP